MAEKLNRTTAGLAGLLSGINSGRQQSLQNQIAIQQLQNQNQTTQWANPYRAAGELDRLKIESDPFKTAMAQMLTSGNNIFKPQQAQAVQQAQAQGLTPQGVVAAGQNNVAATVNNSQPVQVQKFDWLSAGDDDFRSWQADARRRAAATQQGA